MSVDLTGVGNAGIDWSSVLSAVNSQESTTKIEGVKVATDKDGVGLTFSVNEGGTVRSVELSMPMLDSPSEIDEGLIADFCAKIGDGSMLNLTDAQVKAFCDELSAQLKVLGESIDASGVSTIADSKSSQSVMFDIYALMALLVECGQKMRDAARDVRQAENVQVQKSIQNQADMQRTAALTGLICAVVVCTIQVGMQGFNLARLGKGVAQQGAARSEAGIENARADLKMAEMQAKPQDAQTNLQKVAAATDPAVKARVEGTFNDSATTKAAFVSNEALQQRINTNQTELDALTAIQNGQAPVPNAQMSAQNQPGPAQNQQVPAQNQQGPAQNQQASAQNQEAPKLTEAQQARMAELKSQIESDTRLSRMTLDERKSLFRTQVKAELADIRNNPNSTKAEIKYAEAYAANELAQNSTPQQLAGDLALAQSNFSQASSMLQHSTTYLKGVQLESTSRIYGDMIMAIGNVAQSCVSSMSQIIGAEATEEGAEQQKSQEMLDQAKDLFSQCQSLIDSVIQLMRAVLQAEVQSMRDAIQA